MTKAELLERLEGMPSWAEVVLPDGLPILDLSYDSQEECVYLSDSGAGEDEA